MEKVKAGDSIVIKASTWNAFIDAANFTKQMRENQASGGISAGLNVGIILVKNGESQTYDRFSALVLMGISVTPETNEDEFVSCPPVFQGLKMTDDREGKPFCILLEPIEAGEIGRAMVLGITPAKVTINDSEDEYAVPKAESDSGALESSSTGVARILWSASGSGSQWCLLQLGGAGGGSGGEKAYMCKVTGGTAQSGYTVEVYPNGRQEKSTEKATMFLPDIALDADLPSGTWVIGHKSLLAATGGNET